MDLLSVALDRDERRESDYIETIVDATMVNIEYLTDLIDSCSRLMKFGRVFD
jgi:hypothetical protein